MPRAVSKWMEAPNLLEVNGIGGMGGAYMVRKSGKDRGIIQVPEGFRYA